MSENILYLLNKSGPSDLAVSFRSSQNLTRIRPIIWDFAEFYYSLMGFVAANPNISGYGKGY